jgi:hypothetical protein
MVWELLSLAVFQMRLAVTLPSQEVLAQVVALCFYPGLPVKQWVVPLAWPAVSPRMTEAAQFLFLPVQVS